jgi:SAM-dependent methyltransferase
VGCNRYKLPGAVGMDRFPVPGVDVLHDFDKRPWPFADDSFERVVCRHVLAHLADIPATMNEIHRITRRKGIVEIVTPHFSSDNAFTDVTSRWFFGSRSMDYFCVDRPLRYRYTGRDFRLLQSRISFRNAHRFEGEKHSFNPFEAVGLEWLANRFPRTYEHFFAFWLRANEIYFALEVIK